VRTKQWVFVLGVAAIGMAGLLASVLGLMRIAVSAAIVLITLAVLLLADVRDRTARLDRAIEKVKRQGGAAPAHRSAPLTPIEVTAIALEAAAAVDAAGDRVIAAMAMERLAGADRHQEVRAELHSLGERVAARSGPRGDLDAGPSMAPLDLNGEEEIVT